MEPAPVNDGLFGPNSRITSPAWRLWLDKLTANIGGGGSGNSNTGFASNTVANETIFSLSPSAGVATTYARGDHTHGTPVNPITAHLANGDPHTQYQLESEKAAANGYASLDANARVPANQLGIGGVTDNTKVFFNDFGNIGLAGCMLYDKVFGSVGLGSNPISFMTLYVLGNGAASSSIPTMLVKSQAVDAAQQVFEVKSHTDIRLINCKYTGTIFSVQSSASKPTCVQTNGSVYIQGLSDMAQLSIRAHNGQTANLVEWQAYGGAVQLALAANGRDFILDTTTGTKIGTAANQKLGFWNATPVVQDTGWTVTPGYTSDKSFNPELSSLTEVARVLGQLIDTLKSYGILGA